MEEKKKKKKAERKGILCMRTVVSCSRVKMSREAKRMNNVRRGQNVYRAESEKQNEKENVPKGNKACLEVVVEMKRN